jgi:hypothetical protein
MHPIAFAQYEALRRVDPTNWALNAMVAGKHFHIGKDVDDFAKSMADAKSDIGGEDIAYPETARLPATSWVVMTRDAAPDLLWLLREEGGFVALYLLEGGRAVDAGAYCPGSNLSAPPEEWTDRRSKSIGVCQLWHQAFVLAAINMPKRIDALEVPAPRQMRRDADRRYNINVSAYTRVSWDISAAAAERIRRDEPSNYGVALHWRRGHWRCVDAAAPGAKWVEGAGGWAWRVWVKDCFPGHPAFGNKIQIHAPHIGEPSRGGEMPTALSLDRLVVMDAQKAAALRQAGFVECRY